MADRIVRLVADIMLSDDCSSNWKMVSDHEIPPLAALAEASEAESAMHAGSWNFYCSKHNRYFFLNSSCPEAGALHKCGETLSLPAKVATALVARGQAVYPTHEPEVSEGLQETLERVNTLMDDMGFPHLDAEALRTPLIQGKKGKGYYGTYAKPKDKRLADDLGLDPSDITAMRGLAKGNSSP